MTSTPAPGALGRGVAQLIPQPGDASAAGRAAASLTALRNVTGVLEAAVALLGDLQDPVRGADDATVATVTLLRQALHPDT